MLLTNIEENIVHLLILTIHPNTKYTIIHENKGKIICTYDEDTKILYYICLKIFGSIPRKPY